MSIRFARSLLIALVLLVPSAAFAVLNQPSPVPAGLPAGTAAGLDQTRDGLLQQLDTLGKDMARQRQQCGQVADNDSRTIIDCEQSRADIQKNIDAYKAALAAYELSLLGQETNSGGPNRKVCAAKLRVAADEQAIRQMNFANDTNTFEMFAQISKDQREELEQKFIDELINQGLDQALDTTVEAANSAKSLNPFNVNTAIKKLRATVPPPIANPLAAGLRKIAATKGKPGMAAAYGQFANLVKTAKAGYDTGKDIRIDQRNADLRLLLGLLKMAQGNPELGLVVTGTDVGENFAYLGYLSSQVGNLNRITDADLILLNSRIDRLKKDVQTLNATRRGAATDGGRAECST